MLPRSLTLDGSCDLMGGKVTLCGLSYILSLFLFTRINGLTRSNLWKATKGTFFDSQARRWNETYYLMGMDKTYFHVSHVEIFVGCCSWKNLARSLKSSWYLGGVFLRHGFLLIIYIWTFKRMIIGHVFILLIRIHTFVLYWTQDTIMCIILLLKVWPRSTVFVWEYVCFKFNERSKIAKVCMFCIRFWIQ